MKVFTLKMGRKTLKGESLESIQKQHCQYIDDSGKGSSELLASEWNPKVKEDGKIIGHLSYNSNFWAV